LFRGEKADKKTPEMNSVESEVEKVAASIETLSETMKKAEGHLNDALEAGNREAVRL
jgi:hypothetical protein